MSGAVNRSPGWWQLEVALRVLKRGGVVLHATEGVWGLACDPFHRGAVAAVLAGKRRSVEQGLLLIGSTAETFAEELALLPADQRTQVEQSWPGANSWIVPTHRFPAWITGRHDGVGVRVPGHQQARALAAAFGGPLVSTSANRSGRPAPATALRAAQTARELLIDDLYLLPGETLQPGKPSRIRRADGLVLRS